MTRREPTAEQWYFEEIEVGETFAIPSKTITNTHFVTFAGLTGDFHPIHLDEHYAREETPFDSRVAHGMMITMFTIVGASSLSDHLHESAIAFLNQSSGFLNPVFEGDTIYPELEVSEKEDKGGKGIVTLASRVFNQNDEQVLEGELEILVKKRKGGD
ncbi:MaoC family dehydratase [Halovivax gelatinilyticus]|uniref:MaoC family dehydratase n=1 Tax=Halovivax gelatinilyticus TaxID=2961597 RepID=UPI0020CA768D|nr:MaoC/PaaZ C-terminal domain-containing protein [Halovivax gelatinilyticus]